MAMNSDRCGNSWSFRSFDLNMEKTHYEGITKADFEGCSKVVSDDIVDCLPVDPFEMDIKSTLTVTAIKGWLQDYNEDFGSDSSKFGIDGAEANVVDDDLFASLDWLFDGALRLQPQKGSLNISAISIREHSFNNDDNGGFDYKCNVSNVVVCDQGKELPVEGAGDPHDALFFALGYLGMKDLLVVERVCKSLCDAVRRDSLLWRSIRIVQPLSEKITDEALAKLSNRAQGTLQCLSLVDCIRITDNGLRQVLDSNPKLTKLCVPGCIRLTVNGILCNLRALKSAGTLRIKHLRTGGLCGVTEKQFEELKFLLGADNHMQQGTNKPQFYRLKQSSFSSDDDRAIDIETCPRCQKLSVVYDCPAESCQGKDQANQICRACILCIARCCHCGCCIKECDYEETFCLDFLCLDCLKQLLSCEEKPELKGVSSYGRTIFHQEMRYQFCLYGG